MATSTSLPTQAGGPGVGASPSGGLHHVSIPEDNVPDARSTSEPTTPAQSTAPTPQVSGTGETPSGSGSHPTGQNPASIVTTTTIPGLKKGTMLFLGRKAHAQRSDPLTKSFTEAVDGMRQEASGAAAAGPRADSGTSTKAIPESHSQQTSSAAMLAAYEFLNDLYPGTIEWETRLRNERFGDQDHEGAAAASTHDLSKTISDPYQQYNAQVAARANKYSMRWRSRAIESEQKVELGLGASVAVAHDSSFVVIADRSLRIHQFVDVTTESSSELRQNKSNVKGRLIQSSRAFEPQVEDDELTDEAPVGESEDSYESDPTDGFSDSSENDSDLDDSTAAVAQREHFRQQRSWRQRPFRGGILDGVLQILRPTFLHAHPTSEEQDKLHGNSATTKDAERLQDAAPGTTNDQSKPGEQFPKDDVALIFEERIEVRDYKAKSQRKRPSQRGVTATRGRADESQHHKLQRPSSTPYAQIPLDRSKLSLAVSLDRNIAATQERGILLVNSNGQYHFFSRAEGRASCVKWLLSSSPNVAVKTEFLTSYLSQDISNADLTPFDYMYSEHYTGSIPPFQLESHEQYRSHLLAGYESGRIELLDMRESRATEVVMPSSDQSAVKDIIVCPHDPYLFGAVSGFGVKFRDIRKPNDIVFDFTDSTEPLCADWHPTDPSILVVGGQRGAKVWSIWGLSPGGNRRANEAKKGFEIVANIPTTAACRMVRWRDRRPYELALTFDFADNSIYLYDVRRPFRARGVLPGHTGPVSGFSWSHFGNQIISAGTDGRLLTHDLRAAWKPLSVASACSLAWSPLGQLAMFAQPLPRDQSLVAPSGSTPSALHLVDELISKATTSGGSLTTGEVSRAMGNPAVVSYKLACKAAIFSSDQGLRLVDSIFPRESVDPFRVSAEQALSEPQASSPTASGLNEPKTPGTKIMSPFASSNRHSAFHNRNAVQQLIEQYTKRPRTQAKGDADAQTEAPSTAFMFSANIYAHAMAANFNPTIVPGEATKPGYVAIMDAPILPIPPTDRPSVFARLASGYLFTLHSAVPIVLRVLNKLRTRTLIDLARLLATDHSEQQHIPLSRLALPIKIRRNDLFLALCLVNAKVAQSCGAHLQAGVWITLYRVTLHSNLGWNMDEAENETDSINLYSTDESAIVLSGKVNLDELERSLERRFERNQLLSAGELKNVTDTACTEASSPFQTVPEITHFLLSQNGTRNENERQTSGWPNSNKAHPVSPVTPSPSMPPVDPDSPSSPRTPVATAQSLDEACRNVLQDISQRTPEVVVVTSILPRLMQFLLKMGDMQTLAAILITVRQTFFEVTSDSDSAPSPLANLTSAILEVDDGEIESSILQGECPLPPPVAKAITSVKEELAEESRFLLGYSEHDISLAFGEVPKPHSMCSMESRITKPHLVLTDVANSTLLSATHLSPQTTAGLLRKICRVLSIPSLIRPRDIQLLPSPPPLAFIKFGVIPWTRQRDVISAATGLLERHHFRLRVTELMRFRGPISIKPMLDAPELRFALESGFYWPRHGEYSHRWLPGYPYAVRIADISARLVNTQRKIVLRKSLHEPHERRDSGETNCVACTIHPEEIEIEGQVIRSSSGAGAGVCAVCHRSYSGLILICARCGHGGHLNHMLEWWSQALSQDILSTSDAWSDDEAQMFGDISGLSTLCPTGCGHNCVYPNHPMIRYELPPVKSASSLRKVGNQLKRILQAK